MTVQWHLLLYWFTQQAIHLQRASRHNQKVISISWPPSINHKTHQTQGRQIIQGDNTDEEVGMIEVHVAVETEGTLITGMIIKIKEPVTIKYKGTFSIIKGESR